METDTVAADTYLGEDGVFQENWMDSLPEDTFEKDGTGKKMTANLAEHKDLKGLVRSFVGQHKLVGSAIQPLKDDATPEQRAEFFQKFGCPKTVEGYELTAPAELPEGMEYRQDLVDAMAAIAFKRGIAKDVFQEQVASFSQWQIEDFKAKEKAKEAAIAKTFDDGEATLKVEWGADYDKNIEIANKFIAQAPSFAKLIKLIFDLTGKGNHPLTHEVAYELGLQILPDKVVTGGPVTGKKTVEGQLDYSTVVGK